MLGEIAPQVSGGAARGYWAGKNGHDTGIGDWCAGCKTAIEADHMPMVKFSLLHLCQQTFRQAGINRTCDPMSVPMCGVHPLTRRSFQKGRRVFFWAKIMLWAALRPEASAVRRRCESSPFAAFRRRAPRSAAPVRAKHYRPGSVPQASWVLRPGDVRSGCAFHAG